MGGNAIENACRLDASEFIDVTNRVIAKINELDTGFHPRLIPYYRNKQSFGDLDILVSSDCKTRKMDIVRALHSVGPTFNNGNVLSLGIQLSNSRVFQVDLISVPYTDLEIAEFYFSYNDLNLLTGRLAHKLGLKFGFDGLVLKIRTESGHKGLDINLSKDPRRIYNFLGYDYDRYLQGFNELQDVFEFVSSSKYFNPAVFDYSELNHINKTRNRKRETYRKFLEYAQEIENPNNYQFQEKSAYLVKTHCGFPELNIFKQISDYADHYLQLQENKAKFNGGLVMQWTGLKGKELGACLAAFDKYLQDEYVATLDIYLRHNDAEIIKLDFLEFYENNKRS